jgi:hypothetical protein
MFKSFSPKMTRTLGTVFLILALPLAGCVTDQWAEDDTPLTPFGGSKLHPIKVVGNKASVDECGLWPMDSTDSHSNVMLPNHGCAVQANIAAMTAYPQDLVRLRRMSRPPAAARVAAVTALSGAAAAAPSGSSSGGASATPKP